MHQIISFLKYVVGLLPNPFTCICLEATGTEQCASFLDTIVVRTLSSTRERPVAGAHTATDVTADVFVDHVVYVSQTNYTYFDSCAQLLFDHYR
jgi:hypothetical protein